VERSGSQGDGPLAGLQVGPKMRIESGGEDAVVSGRTDFCEDDEERDWSLREQRGEARGGEVEQPEGDVGEENAGPCQFVSTADPEDIAEQEEVSENDRNEPPEGEAGVIEPRCGCGSDQQSEAIGGREPETGEGFRGVRHGIGPLLFRLRDSRRCPDHRRWS